MYDLVVSRETIVLKWVLFVGQASTATSYRNIMEVFPLVSGDHSTGIMSWSFYLFPHQTSQTCAFVIAPDYQLMVVMNR